MFEIPLPLGEVGAQSAQGEGHILGKSSIHVTLTLPSPRGRGDWSLK
jgi:hypothetical protein